MRFVSLCGAIALAAVVPAVVFGQPGSPHQTKTATASGVSPLSKKKVAKPVGPPAKELFAAAKSPAALAAHAIGFYAKGCLAGAMALPVDGAAWQAMRLSRNRNWGHPSLIALIETLAVDARANDGW